MCESVRQKLGHTIIQGPLYTRSLSNPSFAPFIVRFHNIQVKQGQLGTIGNRHWRSSQGFFIDGLIQKVHLLHRGAKHPVHFLHLIFRLPPIKTWVR